MEEEGENSPLVLWVCKVPPGALFLFEEPSRGTWINYMEQGQTTRMVVTPNLDPAKNG